MSIINYSFFPLRYIAVTVLIMLCFIPPIFAQSFQVLNSLQLKHLKVEDGLSQGTINTLFEDQQGFMWVGTENGIDIFDGYKFRRLPGKNSDLAESGVYKISQDRRGLIWYLAGSGLYTYDKVNNHYDFILNHSADDKDDYIQDFVEGEGDIFWLLTQKRIHKYDVNKKKVIESISLVDGKSKLRLNKVISHKKYLLVSSSEGVFVVSQSLKKVKRLPQTVEDKSNKARVVYTLFVHNESELYLGTYNGVFSLNIQDIELYIEAEKALPDYKVVERSVSTWSFFEHDNVLFIGSQKGIGKVNLDNGNYQHLFEVSDAFDSIHSNIISAIEVDNSGIIWLGSNVTGIFKWQPSQALISNYRYSRSNKTSLSNNVVWSINPDPFNSNVIWVTTENGLNKLNINTAVAQRYLVNPDTRGELYTASYISQSAFDSKANLWLGTAVGVQKFDIKSEKLVNFEMSEDAKKVLKQEQFSLIVDNQDNLVLASWAGLSLFNTTTGELDHLDWVTKYISDKDVYHALGFTVENKLLVSSNIALWELDLSSKTALEILKYPEAKTTDWTFAENFTYDKDGNIWLAHITDGIFLLSGKDYQLIKHFNPRELRFDSNVYGLAVDEHGDIWFSSHNGIYQIGKDTQFFRNFNVGHGFSSREFNAGAFLKLGSGELVYGSVDGLSLFNPLELKSQGKHVQSKPILTDVSVLSRELAMPMFIDATKDISLNYDDVGLRFDFSTFGDVSLAKSFKFSISGKENVEFPLSNLNYLSVARLLPGEHKLSVRVLSAQSGELGPASIVNIKVAYPWWSAPAAYFIYILILVLGLGTWLYRKRQFTQELLAAHERIKNREQRLSLALKGSNSAVWDWHAANNKIFAARAQQDLGFEHLDNSYTLDDHIALIHDNDKPLFTHKWLLFMEAADPEESFSCTYRMRTADGEWQWYTDLGKIVSLDSQGKPKRVTGSYTNITDERAKSERAQYFGEAFKQTQDWVMIISQDFSNVIANHAIREAFGWENEEIIFDADTFGLSEERTREYKHIFRALKEGEHWRGEELIKTKNKEEFHVLLNISVSSNEATKELHYVCIFTDITAQKNAEKELRYLANYDHLTNLPNRSLLLERINHAMDYSARSSKSIALFFIDLDRFKQVNDSLGHEYGDILLKEITNRLKKALRVDDTVARLGGDEFVVLLESYRNNNQLTKIAQKLIDVIGESIHLKDVAVNVGASIGIALYPDDAADSDQLLRHADVAMYHAKQLGRNTFQFFTQSMNEEATQRLAREAKIKAAHEQDEFINYYQPIVDSKSGKAVGVELLLRWQHEGRIIGPIEFITIAEEMGLIIPITERAFERSLHDLKQWLCYRPDFYLSINISAFHFLKPGLRSYLEGLLERYQIPAKHVKLEITESTLIKEPERVIEKMHSLKALGVSLSLDDFGTGYSSLMYLKRLPLDVIKIDRAFISGIGSDNNDQAIVDATLVLAKSLRMQCIAEGVESEEQLNYLAQHDCYCIQGFIYSKPVPENQITQFLIDNKVEIKVH
jgi:diguanylate cyclase (GGDEF)-like protein/PAS domain S-box-containing protein